MNDNTHCNHRIIPQQVNHLNYRVYFGYVICQMILLNDILMLNWSEDSPTPTTPSNLKTSLKTN